MCNHAPLSMVTSISRARAYLFLPGAVWQVECSARRYYHPAPPARAVVKAERTFEGISLDMPGSSTRQVATMSRFQLCPACYEAEARHAPAHLGFFSRPPCRVSSSAPPAMRPRPGARPPT